MVNLRFIKKNFPLLYLKAKDRTSQLVVTINLLFLLIAFIFIIRNLINYYLTENYSQPGAIRLPILFTLASINLILIVNEKKLAAAILTSITPAIVFFTISALIPVIVTMHYTKLMYYNALILSTNLILPIIIFRAKERPWLVAALFVFILLSNIVSEYYLTFLTDNSGFFYAFYQSNFLMFSVIKITVAIFFYITLKGIIKRNEEYEASIIERNNLLERSNSLVNNQKIAVEFQNELLEQAVLQRTQEIEQKNRKLIEYAYINSHVLRAPLARIKGLISLIELSEDDESRKKYIEYLKTSTAELDDVVHTIMSILNEEDQEKLSLFQDRIRKLYIEADKED